MTEDEKKAAAILVRICLNKGYSIKLDNGDEWPIRGSTDYQRIVDALGIMDGEDLILYHPSKPGGFFALIYGNNPDELVADHTANDACEEIWQEWQNQLAKEGLSSDSTPA